MADAALFPLPGVPQNRSPSPSRSPRHLLALDTQPSPPPSSPSQPLPAPITPPQLVSEIPSLSSPPASQAPALRSPPKFSTLPPASRPLHSISKKAADVLYGSSKSSSKLEDRLGVRERELEVFAKAPKAYQLMGLCDTRDAGVKKARSLAERARERFGATHPSSASSPYSPKAGRMAALPPKRTPSLSTRNSDRAISLSNLGLAASLTHSPSAPDRSLPSTSATRPAPFSPSNPMSPKSRNNRLQPLPPSPRGPSISVDPPPASAAPAPPVPSVTNPAQSPTYRAKAAERTRAQERAHRLRGKVRAVGAVSAWKRAAGVKVGGGRAAAASLTASPALGVSGRSITPKAGGVGAGGTGWMAGVGGASGVAGGKKVLNPVKVSGWKAVGNAVSDLAAASAVTAEDADAGGG